MSLPLSAYSNTILGASLLVPFMLENADGEWDEVMEQLQAMEWGDGL